jgi:hypothetical protein
VTRKKTDERFLRFVLGGEPEEKKVVAPDTRLPLTLTDRERQLILEESFAPEELTNRLRIVPPAGKPLIARFTLEDLDELSGYIASEANHAKNRKLQKEWEAVFDKIDDILSSHTDEQ